MVNFTDQFEEGFRCCGKPMRVWMIRNEPGQTVRRRRKCNECGRVIETNERITLEVEDWNELAD